MSWARFEAIAADSAQWLWGTAQGAFNEKASTSQIIVDAVIGMIPLVGDGTAVRDLIAVSIGLADDPKKRDDVWQWALLVILLFALIPVLGGVIKGVGRLLIRLGVTLAHTKGLARSRLVIEAAQDIVALLNRLGEGNAERFLKRLNFEHYQSQIMGKFHDFIYTINGVLVSINRKTANTRLLSWFAEASAALTKKLNWLLEKGQSMIPQALKTLNDTLKEIQAVVYSGGQTTSKTVAHTAASGEKAAVHYADELKLLEGEGALISARGGWQQNPASLDKAEKKGLYKHDPGYPDLGLRASDISTYSGKIVNRALEPGETIYRVFGPVRAEGVHGYKQGGAALAAGNPKYTNKFWGIGPPPKTAEEWRHLSAVLDEWNHDGFMLVGTIKEPNRVKGCVGKISEQAGDKIKGQYLTGGGKQVMLEIPGELAGKLNSIGDKVIAEGKPQTLLLDGVEWVIRPTGWKDVNGIHGYGQLAKQAGVQTARLGTREQASKEHRNE
nr:hypothetical protein [Chitinivorax tropicus]